MKVLVATDGSEYSRAAVLACCGLIGAEDLTAVKVVSVFQPQIPMASEPFAISAEHYRKLDEMAEENAKIAADEAAELIRNCVPDSVEISTEVSIGRPAQMIVGTAMDWNADIVVVGSHGRGFWGRLTLSSVSDAVVHHATCSVLVVRK